MMRAHSGRVAFLVMLVAVGAGTECSSSGQRTLAADEVSEDPSEERTETPAQESLEDFQEKMGAGGLAPGSSGGAGLGTAGSGMAGASATEVGGTGVIGPPGSGGSTGTAGGNAGAAGIGGSSNGGAGGVTNVAGAGNNGGSGTVQYPPLDIAQIGKPVRIAGPQFRFTEGPVWDPAKQVLYFSDVHANIIYRLTLPSTFDVLVQASQYANGLSMDPGGNLIVAGFGSRTVWRLDGTAMHTLVDSYQGKKLNSPDDLIARSDGTLYFTDPTFGIDGSQSLPRATQEQPVQGVYRVSTDGTVHLEDGGSSAPNGVELSPDEHVLYVSYTSLNQIFRFSVGADGALSAKTSLASGVSVPDGMCVDRGGNIYVASLGGIAIFDSTGRRLGAISLSQTPTNCAFGGSDQATFFITARSSLIGAPQPGNASLYRVDKMPIPGMPGRP